MEFNCKYCKNKLGSWNYVIKKANIYNCTDLQSREYYSIFFLICKKCKKFVGIRCEYVCLECFGEEEIMSNCNLENWFIKYKKTINKKNYFKNPCKICNSMYYRGQYWIFKD